MHICTKRHAYRCSVATFVYIYNHQIWKIAQVSINSWIYKLWYAHIMEYYLTVKMNEPQLWVTTWVDLTNSA